MIFKEKSIALSWFSTKQKLLLFTWQARPHPADMFNWTCFWKFWEELPDCSPPNCGISCRTCQHRLETRAANVWDLVQSDQ